MNFWLEGMICMFSMPDTWYDVRCDRNSQFVCTIDIRLKWMYGRCVTGARFYGDVCRFVMYVWLVCSICIYIYEEAWYVHDFYVHACRCVKVARYVYTCVKRRESCTILYVHACGGVQVARFVCTCV